LIETEVASTIMQTSSIQYLNKKYSVFIEIVIGIQTSSTYSVFN